MENMLKMKHYFSHVIFLKTLWAILSCQGRNIFQGKLVFYKAVIDFLKIHQQKFVVTYAAMSSLLRNKSFIQFMRHLMGITDDFCLLCPLHQKLLHRSNNGLENILSISMEQKENPHFVLGQQHFIKYQTAPPQRQYW